MSRRITDLLLVLVILWGASSCTDKDLKVELDSFTSATDTTAVVEFKALEKTAVTVKKIPGSTINGVRMADSTSRLSGTVTLKKGQYYPRVFAWADDRKRDAFNLHMMGKKHLLWTKKLNELSVCDRTFSVKIPADSTYTLEVTYEKPGVCLDRIVFERYTIDHEQTTVTPVSVSGPLTASVTANAPVIPLYDCFELTFDHGKTYPDPFFDAGIDAIFTSPSGKKVHVGGFHYGSAEKPEIKQEKPFSRPEYIYKKASLWKVRFAPRETGTWKYQYLYADKDRAGFTGKGSFKCIKGKNPLPGFLKQNPDNPHRWMTDNGDPYFPNGIQECMGDGHGLGTALASQSMEGPFRLDNAAARPKLPVHKGGAFVRGPRSVPANGDFYFRQYSRAGYNMFRISQQNCSFSLYKDLYEYYVPEGIMMDEVLQYARKYGMKVFYGFFGYHEVFNWSHDHPEAMALVQHFIRYSINRWGAYSDLWELLNEQFGSPEWVSLQARYVKSVCPYGKPVTTSWDQPENPDLDFIAPHWYPYSLIEPAKTDSHVYFFCTRTDKPRKNTGKPIILGETGNMNEKGVKHPPEFGGLWDPTSALRLRLRNWTFFFGEVGYVFWVTNYAKDGHFMNIWLGPEERGHNRAMTYFIDQLDNTIKMTDVTVSAPAQVRAYGLAGTDKAAVYLHHYATYDRPVKDITVTLDIPAAAKGYWYNPADAAVVGIIDVPAGKQSLTVPPFTVDLALLVTNGAAPDIDGDGVPNHRDTDNDNDGVADADDAFPLEPEEWADADNDKIGDNTDTDRDADGRPDDRDGDGLTDDEEMDEDGDGVPVARAVPWDAFPRDPNETTDTDGDGIGDNADADDDGDGYSDNEENKAGTDPLNRLSFPL